MLPLLIKDGLAGAHVALSGLFFLLCILGWEYLYTASEPHAVMASIADIRRDKERRDREGLLSALTLALVSVISVQIEY
jgi:Na+/melibiose symporter-like transporter